MPSQQIFLYQDKNEIHILLYYQSKSISGCHLFIRVKFGYIFLQFLHFPPDALNQLSNNKYFSKFKIYSLHLHCTFLTIYFTTKKRIIIFIIFSKSNLQVIGRNSTFSFLQIQHNLSSGIFSSIFLSYSIDTYNFYINLFNII